MDDKSLVEDILLIEKGACDLYMHGTIESSTDSVHNAFSNALNDALKLQDSIYSKMSAKGWYPTEQVEGVKIDNVKQKFSNNQ